MTTDERKPHTPLAEAAALAVALAQAKALLKRAISDRQMMNGAYISEALVRQIRAFLDAVE
jgi:hypothetical protein